LSVAPRSFQQLIDKWKAFATNAEAWEAAAADPFIRGECRGHAFAWGSAVVMLQDALNGTAEGDRMSGKLPAECDGGKPMPCKIIQFPVSGRPRIAEDPIPAVLNREGYILLEWEKGILSGSLYGWWMPIEGSRWIYGGNPEKPWGSAYFGRIARARMLTALENQIDRKYRFPGPYGWEAIRILCAPGPDRRQEFLEKYKGGRQLVNLPADQVDQV